MLLYRIVAVAGIASAAARVVVVVVVVVVVPIQSGGRRGWYQTE